MRLFIVTPKLYHPQSVKPLTLIPTGLYVRIACSSFANEDDQDFISRGRGGGWGGVCIPVIICHAEIH